MHAPASRIAPVEAPQLMLPGIVHAFFTRQGGVSTGLYASLNTGIGSRDDRSAVLENRDRAMRYLALDADRLATPYQVHGAEVAIVEAAWGPGLGPKADGLATRQPGIAIGVGTADCGPVLFADPHARIIGAAHAGWKGAFDGVLEGTVAAMETLGAERSRIVAVLGPTISGRAYEVGPEFIQRFFEKDRANARFFRPSKRYGRGFFDLPAFIVARLAALRLGGIHDVGRCSYSEEERFFSYRRATHREEPDYGRQLSAIALTAG
jgi:YfiH family protein